MSRRKATENLSLYVYCDVSWGCQEDSPSITSSVFKGPVSSCAKEQSTIALSTAEAEYFALSHAVQEAILLRHYLKDISHFQLEATPIYEDNQA
jgi:hypothetical protein